MGSNNQQKEKRLAKNTVLLYIRTFLVMAISLYTSRVILRILGVEDFGIYNVVGGIVAMLSAFSGTLSSAISRYLTFELGRGNKKKLDLVFSTSVTIQSFLAILILMVAEIFGYWFLNYEMNIPPDRLYAANWVLHCSIIAFIINLISIPYNAAIIAHERMSAFAYISIVEVVLKLVIVYSLSISPFDKLIVYSILSLFVAVIIRGIYGVYCKKHFSECTWKFVYDKGLTKEMFSFAGWNLLGTGAYMLNTQGVNLLINLFFGVTLNAARGIAVQVDHAIMQFVNNFTTAIAPQITKSVAAENKTYLYTLLGKGTKYSYVLMLFFAVPLVVETPYVLSAWLGKVPEFTVIFNRLTIIASMINLLGTNLSTAAIATGRVKEYYIIIGGVGVLVFPFTYIAYKLGFPPESTYLIFIIIYALLLYLKLLLARKFLGFPIRTFAKEVFVKILACTIVPFSMTWGVTLVFVPSIIRLLSVVIVSTMTIAIAAYFTCLGQAERFYAKERIFHILKSKR